VEGKGYVGEGKQRKSKVPRGPQGKRSKGREVRKRKREERLKVLKERIKEKVPNKKVRKMGEINVFSERIKKLRKGWWRRHRK
jgi:hypothetical protein